MRVSPLMELLPESLIVFLGHKKRLANVMNWTGMTTTCGTLEINPRNLKKVWEWKWRRNQTTTNVETMRFQSSTVFKRAHRGVTVQFDYLLHSRIFKELLHYRERVAVVLDRITWVLCLISLSKRKLLKKTTMMVSKALSITPKHSSSF